MAHPFYLEKDSEEIYDDFLKNEHESGYDENDEDERQSDRMADMISKYGNY